MTTLVARVTQIIFPEKPTELDVIIIELANYLFKRFGNKILKIERIDGWDGSNIRIVVRDYSITDELIDAIIEFESEKGIVGTILPDIIDEDEYKALAKDFEGPMISDNLLNELKKTFKEKVR